MKIQFFYIYQNVELLPSFGEVDFVIENVRIADLDKGQVLEDKTNVWDAGRPKNSRFEPRTDAIIL